MTHSVEALFNAPAWAMEIDDEDLIERRTAEPSVIYFSDRGDDVAYLMRRDVYRDGVAEHGPLELRIWVGGNLADFQVSAYASDELRTVAMHLLGVAQQLDVEAAALAEAGQADAQ